VNVLSLFDGISCGRVALERAGVDVERYVAFEVDKYATQVSEKNYPKIERNGDVFEGDFTDYKGFDLIIGGSPCTYWSVARTNRETSSAGVGFELFMQYARALEESEAPYFLYENNFGIHKDIQREISAVLGVEPIMINSALVSAQNRKRLYWTNIPGVEQPADKGIVLQDFITDADFTLGAAMRGRYDDQRKVRQQIKVRKDRKSNALTTVQKDCILAVHTSSKIAVDSDHWRHLSPIECERLQTLPDDYTEGVSKTQRHKGIGNGWTVDVIAHIFKNIPTSR